MALTMRALAGVLALAALSLDCANGREMGLPPVIGATEMFDPEPFSGVALNGHDPVAYFERGAPVPGRDDLDLIWAGVAWRFASEANREAFRLSPDAFAPRFGGHDPVAAAEGYLLGADPAVFLVRDGRLYLFRSEASRARFLDHPATAPLAARRWAALRRDLVQP